MPGIPTVPVWPGLVAQGAVKVAPKIKRAIRIAGYTGGAALFLYGALRVRGLIRKITKAQKAKKQEKQVSEMYAEFKKQKQR